MKIIYKGKHTTIIYSEEIHCKETIMYNMHVSNKDAVYQHNKCSNCLV